jgi:hypothetical protein
MMLEYMITAPFQLPNLPSMHTYIHTYIHTYMQRPHSQEQSEASDRMVAKIKTRMADYYENRYLRATTHAANVEDATGTAQSAAAAQRFRNAQQRNRNQRSQLLQNRRGQQDGAGGGGPTDALGRVFSIVDVDLAQATKPNNRRDRNTYRYGRVALQFTSDISHSQQEWIDGQVDLLELGPG